MNRNRPARYTNIHTYSRVSKLGKPHEVGKHRRKLGRLSRRKKKPQRRRVRRVIKPEISQSIYELSKDNVEYSGAFDYSSGSMKMTNAIFREGDTWNVRLPPSQARLLYPEALEEHDRDFEVTWHTHPSGGFPYTPSPQDIGVYHRDSAVLGQETHLVYIEETKTVFVIHLPRDNATKTLKQFDKDPDKFIQTLDKEWDKYNDLPMKQRIPARKQMMQRWGQKYGFHIREVSINDPIIINVIPQEPKRLRRRI